MFERIPEFLRRLRLDHRLTQEELAERTGLSVSQLSRLEQGIRAPRLDTLGRLLESLDLTFAEFSQRYLAFVQELDPHAHVEEPGEGEELEDVAATVEKFTTSLRPMLGTLPPGLNGVQLDFGGHLIYIFPKSSRLES